MQSRGGASLLLVEPSHDGVTPLQLARFLDDMALARQLDQCITSLLKPNETRASLVGGITVPHSADNHLAS
jgi:hypothetical protein